MRYLLFAFICHFCLVAQTDFDWQYALVYPYNLATNFTDQEYGLPIAILPYPGSYSYSSALVIAAYDPYDNCRPWQWNVSNGHPLVNFGDYEFRFSYKYGTPNSINYPSDEVEFSFHIQYSTLGSMELRMLTNEHGNGNIRVYKNVTGVSTLLASGFANLTSSYQIYSLLPPDYDLQYEIIWHTLQVKRYCDGYFGLYLNGEFILEFYDDDVRHVGTTAFTSGYLSVCMYQLVIDYVKFDMQRTDYETKPEMMIDVCENEFPFVHHNLIFSGPDIVTDTIDGHLYCDTLQPVHVLSIYCDNTCDLLIPSAFSPNGDGINDLFVPNISSPDCSLDIDNIMVYDRWGRVVYSGYGYHQGWDGTQADGNLAEIGVFTFVVRYSKDGETQIKKGNITIIR